MGAPREVSTSEDDVGAASLEWLEQSRQVAWVVLEVGVLNCHIVSGDFPKTSSKGRAFALVGIVGEHTDFVVASGESLGGGKATVCRRIIDYQDLEIESIGRDLADPRHAGFERLGFVVAGDDYAESGRHE